MRWAIVSFLGAGGIGLLFFLLGKEVDQMPSEIVMGGYVVSGLLIVVAVVMLLWPKRKKGAEMGQESGEDRRDIHVTSVGQQGGITAGIVNIQGESKPKIELSDMAYRQVSNGHVYEALLNVATQYSVPQIKLTAHASSIQSLDVTPQRGGTSIFGHSGKREGYHFTTIQNAAGKYRVRVVTAEPEDVKIDLE